MARAIQPAAHLPDFSLINCGAELLNAVSTYASHMSRHVCVPWGFTKDRKAGLAVTEQWADTGAVYPCGLTGPVQRRFWTSVAHAQVT